MNNSKYCGFLKKTSKQVLNAVQLFVTFSQSGFCRIQLIGSHYLLKNLALIKEYVHIGDPLIIFAGRFS